MLLLEHMQQVCNMNDALAGAHVAGMYVRALTLLLAQKTICDPRESVNTC